MKSANISERIGIVWRRSGCFMRDRIGWAILGLFLMLKAAVAQESRPVLVLAAASLQTALQAIGAEWQRERGHRVAFSFASSSALARQIEQGAPADLFAPADPDWMEWVEARRLIMPGTRRTLVENRLVLIEPSGPPQSELRITPAFKLADLLGTSRLAMGEPQSAPAGRYAREALTALGIWNEISRKIAGAENVRAALMLVARGEARFGIVYATDALAEARVRVVDTFPASSHSPIHYPVARVATSRNPQAQEFLDYLSSPAATRIFAAMGFQIRR
jgi:molybdate transport system substrate-binding protein